MCYQLLIYNHINEFHETHDTYIHTYYINIFLTITNEDDTYIVKITFRM